eukprot:TRINITY_DN24587_c0_g1_i1.p1 TRINITY_DN24587_c0_g1~~TRINITY_DN24587_c0_g1_i1.p1  ORF type:complete len:786 (-),score=191.56 TRINITY_DN24587_c0_g1_i1:181-2538(-)
MVSLMKNAAGQVEGYEVFIQYLPPETTASSLKGFFSEVGNIVGDPRLMIDSKGCCKGVGWITFGTETSYNEALTWSGCQLGGRKLVIKPGKKIHTGFRPSVQAEGTHTPALCEEVVKKLVATNPGGTYVDGTFGRGGHSKAILAALSPNGRLHAFDMDPVAIEVGKELEKADSRFKIHHRPFSTMKDTLKPLGVKASGVFMDLGISSPQFDTADRGFRLEADGPLDLRFDISKGVTAYEFLQSAPREELIRVIGEYGETTDPIAPRRIADAICLARTQGTLPTRTKEFAAFVTQAKGKEYQAMHPAKLTFQALRIYVNDEFAELRNGMKAGFGILAEGGRLGLLTWKHSECSIVMEIFRELESVRDKSPILAWYRKQKDAGPVPEGWSMEMDDVTRPSDKELATNSRSRSALLHVLRKRRMPRMGDLEQLAYELPGWSTAVEPAASSTSRKTKRKKTEQEVEEEEVAAQEEEMAPAKAKKKKKTVVEDVEQGAVIPAAAPEAAATCNHCQSSEHVTKSCTFGLRPTERFLPCKLSAPYLPCFWRRFIVPLGQADAKGFNRDDPRKSGRADVGMRCITAGLFRSQGLRHNSQVCLSFEASGHTLEISGALARGLVPDEPVMAKRVGAALDALFKEGCGPPDPEADPAAWCASPLRGMEARERTTLAAIKAAVKRKKGADAGGIVMLMLDAEGMPIAEACKQIRQQGPAIQGVVSLIGDHRGFSDDDMNNYAAAAQAAGAEIFRVSLGGTTLLGSHAIAILQHYLDEKMHRCSMPQQIDYSRSGRGR